MTYAILLLGLVILVVGAELLVRGAVVLADLARIPPLVIGLTVVAFGTSAPELAVSVVSSLKGESEIALGNVVGSNIFNVLLIIGLSAIIVPLVVSSQLVRSDVPLMIGASVAVWLAAYDGTINRWEGAAMLISFLAYTFWLIRAGRREAMATENESGSVHSRSRWTVFTQIALVLIGLTLLVLGAGMLVDSATKIARQFGVSDLVIGPTIVAAGTSLPELATSIVAAVKGQRDIAVGNVVGSNLFNLLMVLATASIVSKSGIPVSSEVLWFDLTTMVWVALLCLPMFYSHGVVSRAEGIVLLVFYLAYSVLLIVDSKSAGENHTLGYMFAMGAMPLAFLIAIGFAWRSRRAKEIL
jgi:cation:H+ antiporter